MRKVWNKSRAGFRYRGQNTIWKAEQIAFLTAHYPTDMALHAIERETRHHLYEVKRKAAELGLVRSKTAPPLKNKSRLVPAAKHGSPAFVNANLEDVVGWLRACGHSVTDGVFSGTYKIGPNDSMTPEQVICFANDKRVRCGPEAPSAYAVDPDTGVPW